MTISDAGNRKQYTGNGVTSTFSTGDIIFYNDSDLIVTETVIATGADTVLTLTTDYTVSGGGGESGSITLTDGALPATKRLTIERSIPYTQPDDYVEGESVLAEVLETSFDKMVILVQQLRDLIGRSVTLPATSAYSGSLTLPEPAAGALLGFNSANNTLETKQVADISLSIDTVLSGLSSGDFLNYDGTNWVNKTEAEVANAIGVETFSPSNIGQASTVDTFQEAVDLSFATFQNGNVLCPHTGLVVKYVSATTVDIDATSVTLFNAAGYGRKFSSLNETLDITASGANGLDTGSEASGTWYYLWAIGKVDGTLDGLISASATAPTLPTGYVFKGLLGAVRNDGSSDFVRFFQTGSVVVTLNDSVLSAGTATSYTSIDLSAYVPPTAISVKLYVGPNSSSGTNVVECRIAPAGSGTTDTYGVAAYIYGTYGIIGTSVAAECPMSTAQTVYYRVSGTNARVDINVNGYRYD